MVMKLNLQQKSMLQLIDRSKKDGFGWSQCSMLIFNEILNQRISDELIEVNDELRLVRLTKAGQVLVKWM